MPAYLPNWPYMVLPVTNAMIGIGVGAVTGVIALIATAIFAYRWRRRRTSHSGVEVEGSQRKSCEVNGNVLCEAPQQEAELSSASLYEISQLETREIPAELPDEDYYEIGRAF
jgi:hypothetical protein